jgi:2-dehydrotetronate isomerase
MPRFAANLSMMYTEVPFMERFGAAAKDGFKAVEFLFPYAFDAVEIKAQLDAHGLQQVLFNAPPGDWDSGERGLSSLIEREEEFQAGIAKAIEYAKVLNCPRVHVMAGLVTKVGAATDTDKEAQSEISLIRSQWTQYKKSLAYAAKQFSAANIMGLIEPINTRDVPGYLINRQADAHKIIAEVLADAKVDARHLRVQMDLYHTQIVEGDVAMKIRQFIDGVGHIQIAGVPERHEPSVGELNYPYLFSVLDELGYNGWVGCEYRPKGATSVGLEWFRQASV